MSEAAAFDFDAMVVGAGAVGLACGRALAQRGQTVAVIEQGATIGAGVSSRNSEVIHAGMHYAPGGLKARLCVEGRRALYAFLEAHGVAYDRCGKIVTASGADEAAALDALFARSRENDVEGVRRITGAEARALEPELAADEAILSEQSGVFDSHGYMLALQGDIEAAGGAVVTGTPFRGAEPLDGGGFLVRTGGDEPAEARVRRLVLAPGLSAQECAEHVEGYPLGTVPELHFGKGTYFALSGPAPFRRLIYPPPVKGSVGLHYRRDLGGQAHFGPDLEFVEDENYDVEPERAARFYAAVRRFWPALADGALQPDYAGIRPKLHGPDEPQGDFRLDGSNVHGLEGLVALFGIESPGLTSSLALGEEVCARLGLDPA